MTKLEELSGRYSAYSKVVHLIEKYLNSDELMYQEPAMITELEALQKRLKSTSVKIAKSLHELGRDGNS